MTTHALSIDVEDWFQSVIDVRAPITERFEVSTRKIIDVCARCNVRATFFVLGLAAEKAGHVVKAIADAGHEIQSHGYGHQPVFRQTPDEFRADITRAKTLLEDLIGKEVYAYRAPKFSIDERNLWALDILAETGHRYDSSIFPLRTSRYGIDGYPPEARIISTPAGHRLVEAPVACFTFMGKRLPAGGGGYFRLLPYFVIRYAYRQLDRAGVPGIVYTHPYEYDPVEMSVFKEHVPWKRRFQQGLGRAGFVRKIETLLGEFSFAAMDEVLAPLLEKLE